MPSSAIQAAAPRSPSVTTTDGSEPAREFGCVALGIGLVKRSPEQAPRFEPSHNPPNPTPSPLDNRPPTCASPSLFFPNPPPPPIPPHPSTDLYRLSPGSPPPSSNTSPSPHPPPPFPPPPPHTPFLTPDPPPFPLFRTSFSYSSPPPRIGSAKRIKPRGKMTLDWLHAVSFGRENGDGLNGHIVWSIVYHRPTRGRGPTNRFYMVETQEPCALGQAGI